MKLVFSGKKSRREILKKTQDTPFILKKRFGKDWFYDDNWRNILVLGNNLNVMKDLLFDKHMKGKIGLVYIDPPFSTNHNFRAGKLRTSTVSSSENDDLAYEDKLVGEDYIEFLRERLILLRDLLSNKGSIYVHIDWKMGHYVKVLMDEIFGQEHFVNDIARIKCNPKNFDRKAYGNIKDMILFYSKTNDFTWNDSYQEYTEEQISRLFPKIDKDGRRYTTYPLHAPGETRNGPTGQSWKGMTPPKGRHWRCAPETLEKLDKEGLIEWSSKGNPRRKAFADETDEKPVKRQDVWEFKDPPYPKYPTEKNLDMLKTIIEASSNVGDIVLDCFAGSGTTIVAAEQLNRKWIGIDSSAIAIERTLRRIIENKNAHPFAFYTDIKSSITDGIQKILQ